VAIDMTWFRRPPKNPEDLAQVKSDIETLRLAMVSHEERVRAVTESVAPPIAAPEPAPGVADGDPTAQERAVTDVSARLDGVVEQIGALDARITAVSTELANQLSELGNDIDSLQNRPPGAPVDEEVLEDLRDTQERLANEQARYQIAFRADLARLAEQLRRPAR